MPTELWMTQLLSLKAVSMPDLQAWGYTHHDHSIPAHNCCKAGACKICVMCNIEGANHKHSRQEMLLDPSSAGHSSQQCCEKMLYAVTTPKGSCNNRGIAPKQCRAVARHCRGTCSFVNGGKYNSG